LRARAEKSLESATKFGKVDAGRAAREQLRFVRFRLFLCEFLAHKIPLVGDDAI
jgi:hypothetical protein